MKTPLARLLTLGSVMLIVTACVPQTPRDALPSVAPTTQPTASLQLGGAEIRPMYRELLAVDLSTVMRVAMARSIDIEQAKARVDAARGRYESNVEAIFPVIAPALTYQYLHGANQNANGTLALTNFNNLLPGVTVEWIVNPAQIYYDIVASKRRVEASAHDQQSTELSTLRTGAVQYYELVLTQARVAAARKAAAQAEEALRLAHIQVRNGTGLPADELRARAFLAGRRQDLLLAVNNFYQASLDLTLTLHLDPTVTLVPNQNQIGQITLVREELGINALLALAVRYRPDLKSARSLLQAADADKGATIWGALGPQLRAAYTYGGFATRGRFQNSGLHEQQKGSASAGFAFGMSTFGRVKTADATLRSAALDVERQLDEVRAQVVNAQQASRTNAALIPIAREQVESAQEALRLAQANLKEGNTLLLDVLQSEDEVDAARLHHADAVAHYNQSQVNLLAALGLLEAQKLIAASEPAPAIPVPLAVPVRR